MRNNIKNLIKYDSFIGVFEMTYSILDYKSHSLLYKKAYRKSDLSIAWVQFNLGRLIEKGML